MDSALPICNESQVVRDRADGSWRRQPVKLVGEWIINRLGCGLSRVLGSRAGGSLGILTYHRIAPWADAGPAPTWNVTPERFRQQMAGLLARGYQPLPLRTVLALHRAGRPIPPRTFVVTFDDGYENIHRHAWPVLCELGVPATIFLATAYLDSAAPFPFESWSLAGLPAAPASSWKPLTTDQCREMLAQGLIDLGSHTHTHGRFRGQPDVLAEEMATSLEVLRTRFGLADATFSFPYGITAPELTAAVRRSGALCALTTEAVLVGPHDDPFTWGRFGVKDSDSVAVLAGKLEGWYSLARQVWLHFRRPRSAGKEATAGSQACPATEAS